MSDFHPESATSGWIFSWSLSDGRDRHGDALKSDGMYILYNAVLNIL